MAKPTLRAYIEVTASDVPTPECGSTKYGPSVLPGSAVQRISTSRHMSVDSESSLVGATVRFGKHRATITRLLGEGTTASVYLAEEQLAAVTATSGMAAASGVDTAPGADVAGRDGEPGSRLRCYAVKILQPAALDTPTQRERFGREAEILCAVHDPGLVAGYASGVYHDCPFVVLEYCPGGSLAELIAKGPMPVERALSICEEVLCALDHLRLGGHLVCHRDIKPANILLDVRGHAKLADLGIAKTYLHVAKDIDTGFTGTIRYMAPEQIDDAPRADIRADLFSLGAVFYEMISGSYAFPEKTKRELLARRLDGQAPGLPERAEFASNSALAAACSEILNRTLAADVLDRVQTPSELLALIRRAKLVCNQRTHDHPAQQAATLLASASIDQGVVARSSRRLSALIAVALELAAISVACTGVVWGLIETLERFG